MVGPLMRLRWALVLAALAVGIGSAQGAQSALQFTGDKSYITMGRAPGLGLSQFTLEAWIKGTGASQVADVDGVSVIPLICKGRTEAEGDNRDLNYFFGVLMPNKVIAAAFEDAVGNNHPVIGTTVLNNNTWYHVAATYDGASFRLFLNGQPEAQAAQTATPRYNSIQHFSLATALNSAGIPDGYFNGIMDEVRVWNYARTQVQIQDSMSMQIASATGLVGRWGFEEGTGQRAGDNGTSGVTGFPCNASWVAGKSLAARLDVVTLAAAQVSTSGATLNGRLTDLNGLTTAQVQFRWGTVRDNLDQTTPVQILTSTAQFSADISGLSPGLTYYYRAVADSGTEHADGPIFEFLAATNSGLMFDGTDDYARIESPTALGLQTFTLECWFMATGPGQTASSGAGGFTGVPLIAKGHGQTDGGNQDCNYFLAIRVPGAVLAADFEDNNGGLNHPVHGVTAIQLDEWHHAAATYDGAAWKLYLDGRLENTRIVNATPQFNSLQPFGLGAGISTNGNAAGRFQGVLDEVRIWNYARTREEIVSAINSEIPAATGLVARWGFGETAGFSIGDSSGNGRHLCLAGGMWVAGTPLNMDVAPDAPSPIAPAEGAVIDADHIDLRAQVHEPDGGPIEVKFYGRKFDKPPVAPFRIVALPDTQYYSASYPAIFAAQAQWIVDHQHDLNIVYVAHEGDIVDDATVIPQWQEADAAIGILESADDLPFGLCAGNHDEDPNGDPNGTTVFNNAFPCTRFEGRPWYGGHYGATNDNHYILFSAGGMDFIAIHFKFDPSPPQTVLDWAGGLLAAYPERRAIVVGHSIVYDELNFSEMGAALYNVMKGYPNLFLMLCGHFFGEERRTDVAAGTVYSLLADYQYRDNGGDGWLRILEFRPDDNLIHVQTYSPVLDQWEPDHNSDFILPYTMGGPAFTELDVLNVPGPGAEAATTWASLEPGRIYEWYATASDGQTTVAGPVRRFTTQAVRPDLNADGRVDSDDFELFEACATGPGVRYDQPSPPPGCTLQVNLDGKLPADLDEDGDVDQSDFGIFQRCYGGADGSPGWGCAD